MQITIYTDGSARGNPGTGGYGAVMFSGVYRKELSAGYRLTTNNRMELLAVIVALEKLKFLNSDVKIFTDSKYVCESVEKKWVYSWALKGFQGKKNSDLWIRFLKVSKEHKVKFSWVKGHAGNKENERCDELATKAANGNKLLIDTFYEKENRLKSNKLL